MNELVNFDDLNIGARFKYQESELIWIKLDGDGVGKIVGYEPLDISGDSGVNQSVVPAKENAYETLMVRV